MRQQQQSSSKHRQQPKHGQQQADKVPQEKEYKMYAKCDADELQRRLIPEILQEFPERGLRLYGNRLPRCDQLLVKSIEALKLQPLAVGTTFKGNHRQFRIEKPLGQRSYRIVDLSTKTKYFLKLEALGLPKQGPSLKRDILVLNNAFESSPKHRRHFLSIFDRGVFPNLYNFVILQLCDCNLSDLRSERLNGADFSRSSALHIASQTLQGIHDVQLHHYYHRDIRSGNFVVGLNEHYHMIYIVNFSLSYEYFARHTRLEQGKKPAVCETPRVTPKLPWISCRFQSRAFHLGQAIRRLDDIESWIYLMIDTFDQKTLPWKKAKSERVGYEQKERLFMGDYAEQLGELKPYVDVMIKYLEHSRARNVAVVDFPFFGNILEQMAQDWKITGKEPLDWMPDTCGTQNISRIEAAKKSKDNRPGSKKTHKQPQAPPSPAPALAEVAPPPPEDDFNFLPVIAPEPIKPTTKDTVKEPAEATNTDTTKKIKEKQSPMDGSGKNNGSGKDENENNNKAETTDKKDINAIRKASTTRRASRATAAAAKKSVDESETKKKEKEKDKEEESDPNKSPKESSKKENDSKDESVESST